MNEYHVEVLGNDKCTYMADDFVAAGKTYKDSIGIVFGSSLIGRRLLAFDSWFGEWGEVENLITTPRTEPQAIHILCGLEDTLRIVKAQAGLDQMTAAKWCWQYQKGGFQWYLPSVMELLVMCLVRNQINDAMSLIGCDSDCLLPKEPSKESWIYSSTEYDADRAWNVSFDLENAYLQTKFYSSAVRAVASPFLL